MPMLNSWRLIETPKLPAEENMQIDRELFSSYKEEKCSIFRLYEWEEGFSYGVNQDISKIDVDFGFYSAKRLTGGGVLLHGHDISYTIITKADRGVKKSYEHWCGFLFDFYKMLGLNPSFAKDLDGLSFKRSKFCQIGFEPYDIIIEGKKIGGNAQKHTKDAILQHGSIPIKKIVHPLAGYSLVDLGVEIDEAEAREMLKYAFCKRYNIRFLDE